MRKIVTLDIGGTNIKVGIFEDEVLVQEAEIPTLAKQGAKDVIDRCIAFVKQYMPCDGIGISTCGQVNNDDGSIHYANENMPGYTGMQVKKIFENEFHVKVTVENDVYAAARGENQYGAGKGYKDFICLTYGTGIGGGIYLNGQPYYGAAYLNQKFARNPIDPHSAFMPIEVNLSEIFTLRYIRKINNGIFSFQTYIVIVK